MALFSEVLYTPALRRLLHTHFKSRVHFLMLIAAFNGSLVHVLRTARK